MVERGEAVDDGKLLAVVVNADSPAIQTNGDGADDGAKQFRWPDWTSCGRFARTIRAKRRSLQNGITVVWREEESRAYDVNPQMTLRVNDGQQVNAGAALVDGPLDLRELLDVRGLEGLQHYLVDEVQEVYRSQGVGIHDKHIEVILRQMLRRVQVETSGDTEFIPGDVVDKFRFQDQNQRVLAEGGEPSTAKTCCWEYPRRR